MRRTSGDDRSAQALARRGLRSVGRVRRVLRVGLSSMRRPPRARRPARDPEEPAAHRSGRHGGLRGPLPARVRAAVLAVPPGRLRLRRCDGGAGRALGDVAALPALAPGAAPRVSPARLVPAARPAAWRPARALVLATSAEGEGALFQAFFRPIHFEADHSVSWLGYLQGLFIDPYGNIRADSDGDKKLKLTIDDIVHLSYSSSTGDTVGELFRDSNGDGIPDSTTPYKTIPLVDLPTLWEAGKNLAETHPDDRTIFTTTNGTQSGKVNFVSSSAATLQTLLRANSVSEAEDYINFIRGVDLSNKGYRDKRITINGSTRVWKLADIVYSTPTVVSVPSENYDLIYGDKSYFNFYNTHKNRKAVIYVGSNDGLLHAFSAGKFTQGDDGTGTSGYFTDPDNDMGKELWAFIPRSFLPHIQWQTDKNYKHIFGIDLKVKISDIQITKNGTKQWATVLIGGMRLGGGPISVAGETINPAYFAIDVTDPANPEILWEFSHPDLGLTLSYPAVIKKGTKWYAIFGSGPFHDDGTFVNSLYHDNNGYRAKSNKTAKFFIVDIDNKSSWA